MKTITNEPQDPQEFDLAQAKRPGDRLIRFLTSGFSLSPMPKPASVNSKPELAAMA